MTFFNELTTQSKTAFNFGTRFIVFSGLRTRNTRSDFIVFKFLLAESLSLTAIANNAHITTIESNIFQTFLKYDPGCKTTPRSIIFYL